MTTIAAGRVTVTNNAPQAVQRIRRGTTSGVNKAIEALRGHSVAKAPVDLGDLRGSATTTQADESTSEASASLLFDEPYAAKQHEDESLNHTPGAHGEPAGEARYVASNYEDASRRAQYVALVATEVQRELAAAV